MEEGSNSSSAPGQHPGAHSAPVRGPLQRGRAFYVGCDENDGDGMDTAEDQSANFLQVILAVHCRLRCTTI